MTATAFRRAELTLQVNDGFDEFRQPSVWRRIGRGLNSREMACGVGRFVIMMRETGPMSMQSLTDRVTPSRPDRWKIN